MIFTVVRCDTRYKKHAHCSSMVYEWVSGSGSTFTLNARTHEPHTCGEDELPTTESVLGKNTKENAMLKAKITRRSLGVEATALKVGDIGIITEKSNYANATFVGEPVMRTYTNYVLLTNPQHTWEDGYGIYVEPLTNGDTITLTVGAGSNDAVILGHLKNGNKIQAIKARREFASEGLKEAKQYVDDYEHSARLSGKLPPLPLVNSKPNWA